MVISPSSLDTNLSQLLLEVDSGKIQLPEFQRSWTWDDNRIRGIIASLSQGYPMGAIMRLQYGNPEIKFKYRTIEGVAQSTTEPEFLVLDGQQRLTSIYQSVYSDHCVTTKTEKGKAIERYYYLSMEKCLDENEDRIEAVVGVPKDRKLKENFDRDIRLDLSDREKEYKEKMFPVNIIFSGNLLMDWTMGYWTYYNGDTAAIELFKAFKCEVIDTISAYKLPVITLDKSTPREAVCKVFENVNTGGVPLTVFELVTATFATYTDPSTNEGFDLRKDWERIKRIIQGRDDTLRTDLLDGIDETTFLTTVALYTSYKDKQDGKVGAVVNSMLQSPDIHHIFPEAYCEKAGIKRSKYNSVVNKTPMLPETNRSIGGNAPSQYTKAIIKKVSGLTEDELKSRIESHLINYEALISDDFDTYFIDRAKKMLDLIESAMGKPVADRDAENTIEQFGASLT